MIKDKQERPKLLELLMPIDIPLVRYIKIRGESNPFNNAERVYFRMRRRATNDRRLETNNLTAGLLLKEGLQGA